MAEVIYHCKEEHHNKRWSYEIDGLSVTIKWGRVGLDGQSQVKTFSSQGALDKFLNKKIEGKLRKGYEQVDQQTMKEETKTAKELGYQNMIKRVLWMDRDGNRLTQITNYDPKRWIYVEVLDSWKKTMVRLLLSKTESLRIEGGITEVGDRITFSDIRNDASHFVTAVRNHLKRIAAKVVEVIKTIKFAAVGARDLSDSDVEVEAPDFTAVYEAVGGDVDTQVIGQFAMMGARTLEL